MGHVLGIVPTDMTRRASVVYQLIFNNSACVYEGKEDYRCYYVHFLLKVGWLRCMNSGFSNEGPKSTYVAPQY